MKRVLSILAVPIAVTFVPAFGTGAEGSYGDLVKAPASYSDALEARVVQ